MSVSDSVEFRLAMPDDASRIAALHAESWRTAYGGMLSDEFLNGDIDADRRRVWLERLNAATPRLRVVLAEIEGRLAGFACALGSEDPQLGTLLDNLHVSREFQRQGIGAKLMSEIASWCQAESPGEGLFLWVLESNFSARQFYEDLGAVNVGEDVWLAPDGGSIPSLCYAWPRLDSLTRALTLKKLKR